MDALLARVGFGCGRLRGGAEESNSRRVLSAALDCGIRYFDTAPAYGGGASERILGQGLRGLRQEVELCTKVGLAGSPPDAAATLRAWLLTGVRTVLPASMLEKIKQGRRRPPARAAAVRSDRQFGDFGVASMRASVERSLAALDTGHLDCLMLHEPRPSDPPPEAGEWLAGLAVEGRALRIGVGTYAGLDELPAFGEVAQCAIGPAVFADCGSRALVVHGVLRDFDAPSFAACANAAGLFAAAPALKELAAGPLGSSALLLSAVILGTNVRRVLISTGSPRRLREFMSAAAAIFSEAQNTAHARGVFGTAAQGYFAQQSAATSSQHGGANP